MNEQLKKVIRTIHPYKNILYFMVLLLVTHFLWKIAVDGNLNGHEISIFGIDATAPFEQLSRLTAKAARWTVRLFPDTDTFQRKDTILYFTDAPDSSVIIIWGCTAVKQLYIFLVIMLLFPGPWRKKLWYIPLGCLILIIYNIVRIAVICMLIKNHPERFEMLHEGVFRYIFYGLIFLLWLIWEEKISKSKKIQS